MDNSVVLETLVKAAHKSFLAQEYTKSAQFSGKALRLDPGNNTALFLNGASLYHLEKPDEAYRALYALTRREPDHEQAWLFLAMSVFQIKNITMPDIEFGVRCYQTVLTLNPDNATALGALALYNYNSEKYEAAAKLYERYLAQVKDDPVAHVNYADSLSALYQYAAAEKHFLEALRLDPDNADIFLMLADLYEETADYQKAFDTAIKGWEKACSGDEETEELLKAIAMRARRKPGVQILNRVQASFDARDLNAWPYHFGVH